MHGYTKRFVGLMDSVTGEGIEEVDQTYFYTYFIGELDNEMIVEQMVPALHEKGTVYVHAINCGDGWIWAWALEGIGEDVTEFYIQRNETSKPAPEPEFVNPSSMRGCTVRKLREDGPIYVATLPVTKIAPTSAYPESVSRLAAVGRKVFIGRIKYGMNAMAVYAVADAKGSVTDSVWYIA